MPLLLAVSHARLASAQVYFRAPDRLRQIPNTTSVTTQGTNVEVHKRVSSQPGAYQSTYGPANNVPEYIRLEEDDDQTPQNYKTLELIKLANDLRSEPDKKHPLVQERYKDGHRPHVQFAKPFLSTITYF